MLSFCWTSQSNKDLFTVLAFLEISVIRKRGGGERGVTVTLVDTDVTNKFIFFNFQSALFANIHRMLAWVVSDKKQLKWRDERNVNWQCYI